MIDALRDLLPVTDATPVVLFEGGTPLVSARALYVHLVGPIAAPGEIAAMRIASGGFSHTDLPAVESDPWF